MLRDKHTDRVFEMSTNRYIDKVLKKTTDCQVVRQPVMPDRLAVTNNKSYTEAHVGTVKSFGHSPYAGLGLAAELSEASD